jgi:hypothetical protein
METALAGILFEIVSTGDFTRDAERPNFGQTTVSARTPRHMFEKAWGGAAILAQQGEASLTPASEQIPCYANLLRI